MKLTTDIFSEFDQVWALVTAGTPDNFNTMTISWGGMGTLWGKPVATVYIRTSRYTPPNISTKVSRLRKRNTLSFAGNSLSSSLRSRISPKK